MKKLMIRRMRKAFLSAVAAAKVGSLTLVEPDGSEMRYGAGRMAANNNGAADAQLHIKDWRFVWAVAARGDIGLAESYVSGDWDTDNIENLIAFFLNNMDAFESYAHGRPWQRLLFRVANTVWRRNSRRGSRSNIAAHYDVGNDFYELWLDPSMTYSSALYQGNDMPLENAQQAKYQRILDRLAENTREILEIGCGWGGFAEQAAANGKRVTAVTISPSQHMFARRRLQDRADVRLQDYRDIRGTYDGIVSIEMFEAVGEKYWPAYFNTIKNSLSAKGKAVIQTITIDDRYFEDYRKRSDFIRHYIFPGGMLPAVSRFKAEAEKVGLKCSEPFAFGHDYARTLREWLARFDQAQEKIASMGYDEKFRRSWRFYLAMCAAAFAVERTNVVHFELSHAA